MRVSRRVSYLSFPLTHKYSPTNLPQKKHEGAENEARRQQKAKKMAEEKYVNGKMKALEDAKNRAVEELAVRTHARCQHCPVLLCRMDRGAGGSVVCPGARK